MKWITDEKVLNKALEQFYGMLNMEDSKCFSFPIFNNEGWSCMPLFASFANPNKANYQLIHELLTHFNSLNYNIYPIDDELKRIKSFFSKSTSVIGQNTTSFEGEVDCGCFSVEINDRIDDVFKFINCCDCFLFANYLAFDNSYKWFIVEIDFLPYSCFFYKNDYVLEQKIERNYNKILVSCADFAEEMDNFNAVKVKDIIMRKYATKFK
jgi:hypothetical protein